MKIRNSMIAIASLLSLAACAAQPVQPAPAATPAAEIPTSVRWQLISAEKRALFAMIFRAAGDRVLELAAGRERGSWAVIADADETLLDNSEYLLMLARTATEYSEDNWRAWLQKRRSIAVPGSQQFVDRVLAAGGAVVVVANRDEALCDDTRANLLSEKLRVTAVLCASRDPATGKTVADKNPRFQAVQNGTAVVGLPALSVLAWLGDSILDFPGRTQKNAEPLTEFGDRLFLLPNPMYGSWEWIPIP
jgi:5'-nucleotidase (lipoprotein e(P4) family)